MSPGEARQELGRIAKRYASQPQTAVAYFRSFVGRHPSHLLSAYHVWRKWFDGDFTMTPHERWVIQGTDKYGEPFLDEGDRLGMSREEAEEAVEKMNARGGDVKALREVFNGSGACWDRADD
jgi:hypothetical protein